MRKQLQRQLERRVQQCVTSSSRNAQNYCEKIEKKKELLHNRSAEIVKAKAVGVITEVKAREEVDEIMYTVHFQYLIKQKDFFYLEEEIEQRVGEFYRGVLVEDLEWDYGYKNVEELQMPMEPTNEEEIRIPFHYNRLKAVQYAEKWWNSNNPAYKSFSVDCTNYISQCLHTGGAPMRGYPDRAQGWWIRNNNWSYSWTVANSMRLNLSNSKTGLRAKQVESAEQLKLGDVICYDFQGDGKFDHTTIVISKDKFGQPLVNAHTSNSRMRYWAYEDSTAYTPNIKYKFFTIVDDQ